MLKTTLKSRLQSGKTILATFLQIPAAEMAEVVGLAGFDCGIIDTEHGMMGLDASIQLVRGCDAVGLTTAYRVPGVDHQRIGLALDFGASAVMVPNITNKQDAERAVDAAKYHPEGSRGVCPFARGARYNAADENPDYYSEANQETAVVLQIEASEGIANLDKILEVPCIDCIFIGPFDLAQSLGIPGKVTDKRVLAAISEIVQRADRKGVAVGNFSVTPEQAHHYMETGVRFLAYGTDTLIVHRAYRDLRKVLLSLGEHHE
jgi:4-hydroxy-2-oxoheptanedioate aldolase